MSRKFFAVAALALMAPIAASQAQVGFGIAAGASIPSGDGSETVNTGYHVMATVAFSPPAMPVGFRVDGMFNEFGDKAGSDTKVRIMGLTANAVLGVPGAVVVSPYLIGGVGMYNSTLSPKPVGFESSNDFGFNIGGGIKFGLAGFGAFAEARYHHISTEGGSTSFIPITFGVIF